MMRVLTAILPMACLSLGSTLAQAQAKPEPATPTAPALTRPDLEAWLDGLVPSIIRNKDIAGAVVAVVKDGAVLLQKGYGYADVASRKPVDPERTVFRAGSISKVFAATAAMQLVEQGKLELDRDINGYLDFTIPAAFGKPITLRHLLTHTAGFEESAKDAWMLGAAPPPLGRYLPAHLPAQIYPPGEVTAYSNYGMALVGYLIERASGETFEAYVDRHLFQLLGMTRSTFLQPLSATLEADMSKGYLKASALPRPFEVCAQTSAGSLSITAADMAHFMIAHLQLGSYGDQQILKPETAELMHSRVPDAFPTINGMALAFQQSNRNGHRILAHGGDTGLFHSKMELLLDAGVGFFISFNSTGTGGDVRAEVLDSFIDRYFPAPAPAERETLSSAREHARLAAGRYESSRRWDSSFFRLLGLLQTTVTANDDGTIVVPVETGLGSSKDALWREVEPFVWQQVGGPGRIAMSVRDGKVSAIKNDDLSSMELLPVPAWRSAAWNIPLLIGAIFVLAATILLWPAAALTRRYYALRFPLTGREATISRVARVAAIANLMFLVSWVTVLRNLVNGNLHFFSDAEPRVRAIQLIGLVGILGTGIAVWNARLAWRNRRRALPKLGSTLLAGACLSVVWFIFAFKLITLKLTY